MSFFSFAPNIQRAKDLDSQMRAQLFCTLQYLKTELEQHFTDTNDGLEKLISGMALGNLYPASTFGFYYQTAFALLERDLDTAKNKMQHLIAEAPINRTKPKVHGLATLPIDNQLLYQKLMDTDPNTPFHILSPPTEQLENNRNRVINSLNRLRDITPELAGEFDALINEVILVVGDRVNGYDFAGGSSYMLWGALFINAEQHNSEIAMMEAIAHESAHSLLFGFTQDEPLVKNPDDDLYCSPLRDDARPMDGIYHATYVSARMHWLMDQLIKSGTLSSDELQLALEARQRDRDSFFMGYSVVEEHGLLSGTGKALMDSALEYMQQT